MTDSTEPSKGDGREADPDDSPKIPPAEKTRYLKIPPELFDGSNYSVTGIDDTIEFMQAWWGYADIGDSITLEVVEMTDAEILALPEI